MARSCFRSFLSVLLCLGVIVCGPAPGVGAAPDGPPPGRAPATRSPAGPELVLQNGHTQQVTAVSFSPNGRRLATASEDESIKLWDLESGRVRGTLHGHGAVEGSLKYAAGVTSVAFSPDGRHLASGSRDCTVRIWDVSLEKCATVLTGHQGIVTGVAWTPDGQGVVSGSEDGTVRLWDAFSGKAVATLPQNASVRALSLSMDGKQLAVGMGSDDVAMWDLPGRKQTAILDQNAEAVALSPDGRTLVVGSWEGTVGIWDLPTSKRRDVKIGDQAVVSALAVSPDGRRIAASPAAGVIVLLELSTAREVGRLEANPAMITALAYSTDGTRLASGGYDDKAWVHDPAGGSKPTVLQGLGSAVSSLACSGDGRLLVTGSRLGSARLWDLASGRLRGVVSTADRHFAHVALSPDGRRLAVGFSDGSARLRDLTTGGDVATFPSQGRDSNAHGFGFTRDGHLLAIAHDDGFIRLWEVAGPRLVASFEAHRGGVSALVFAADGRTLYSGGHDGAVRAWNMQTRANLWTRKLMVLGGPPRVWDLVLSPDGRTLASATAYGTAHLWDIAQQEASPEDERNQGRLLDSGNPRAAFSVAYSPDGRTLALAVDQSACLFDARSGRRLRSVTGHAGRVTGVVFVAEGRVLVTCSNDTTVRYWDVASGSLLATALEIEGGNDWVVTTPEGRFDGSSAGQRMIEWRVGGHMYALDQFFNGYFSPGLLAGVAGPSRKTRAPSTAEPTRPLTQVKPPPQVVILSPQSGQRVTSDTVTVTVKVSDQGGGTTPPMLYLNGKRLSATRGEARGEGVVYQVTLTPGRNVVRATSANSDKSVESRGDEVVLNCEATPSRGSRLFVLAVGVDRYQAGLKLGFAVQDARAMAGFFKPGLFSDVKVRLMLNGEAGRSQIIGALEDTAREATPQDAVLLYFAGHGAALGDMFYFLPYDARVGSDDEIRSSCISSVELGERLSNISATKQVVVLDACHSGASASALGRMLAARDPIGTIRAQQRLARSSGTFLVAASTADQYAKEFPELGHGVLTYAILTGLGEKGKPAAAVGESGNVTVNALLQYVSDEVPLLAEKYQGGRQDVVQFSTGQDFPLIFHKVKQGGGGGPLR